MYVTEIGTSRFKIERQVIGEYPNSTVRMALTVGQYPTVHFEERALDELIEVLTTYRDMRNGGVVRVLAEEEAEV